MDKIFADFGIIVPSGATGEVDVICPQCSPLRKKKSVKDLSVNVEKGTWNCHHCGWKDGLKKERDDNYIPPPKAYKKPKGTTPVNDGVAKARHYLNQRGLSMKTVQDHKIVVGTYYNKETLQFPYFRDGQLVNIKHQDSQKKRNMEAGAELCLYRLDKIKRTNDLDQDVLVITEGEIDCLSCVQAGFAATSVPNGAPPPDAQNFQSHFKYLESAEDVLAGYEQYILAGDNDEPGRRLIEELARRLGVHKCFKVKWPEGCKDANDVLVKYGLDQLKKCLKDCRPYPIHGIYTAMDCIDDLIDYYNSNGDDIFSTGWKKLDKFYKVAEGELTVITGIPGSGKSEFMENLAVNMARDVKAMWPFAFFSPENWPLSHFYSRMIEKVLCRPLSKDDNFQQLSKDEIIAAAESIRDFFPSINEDYKSLSLDRILELAESAVYRYGIKGLVIDPWNEVDHQYRDMTEAQYLSKALSAVKNFAKKYGVHVWIVAHPRLIKKDANGDYPIPTMYDISGGAHWRNKADNGLCVHRSDWHKPVSTVFIQKIRYRTRGRAGYDIDLDFNTSCGIFSETLKHQQEPLY